MYVARRIYNLTEITGILKENNLAHPGQTDYTIGVYENEYLISTGSLTNNIIHCLATRIGYKNEGIINTVVSELFAEAQDRGINHIFLFTKLEHLKIMERLGFNYVGRGGDNVTLLEHGIFGIESYKEKLRKICPQEDLITGAIVMNLNPLTNGHLYLIRKVAQECDKLFIFVVQEDKSFFPFKIRMALVKEETQNMDNVTLLPSGDYIISEVTFPSYFLKKADIALAHAYLDIDIFIRHIAPSLNISKRFVGQEPYCELTQIYNQCMRKMLPPAGIEFIEIERLKAGDVYISASHVRQLAKKRCFEEIKKIVPESTYNYLTSEEGRQLFKSHIL